MQLLQTSRRTKMKSNRSRYWWAAALLLVSVTALQGCDGKAGKSAQTGAKDLAAQERAVADSNVITVQHELGTTVLKARPKRVVPYDMSVLDSLDQLGITIVGMPKDYVPRFLSKYQDNPAIQDVGGVLQPNLEQLHAVKPDLVLISPLEAGSYQELSQIAPTIYFDVDYMNQHGDYIGGVKKQLMTLGHVFGVEDQARKKIHEIETKVDQARAVIKDRPEKALIVMHNNGAFTAFGVQSRYGFIFDTLGVKPASQHIEPGLHGQPISNEFIHDADPDIIYVVDRTAAHDRKPVDPKALDNPLLRQTKAWKTGRVVFVNPDVWYLTGAGVTSLEMLIDEVLKGYTG
ncbi:siderophore ABC transporter substrate-binding protein [Pseudomonas aeruginosa]|nr:ferric anguibactin-binding protein [Pseudomonas aeruginosa]MBF1864779.1 siderophore ABC transporter substrate-binding protein [Pseudomonas aeruginosa]MBX6652586.1 siderophore ABC transporter substrate-binding protein [Pseudomonas aeruginosa]MBX6813710.1 siderophore ABC transporter substrate-binding protein [Pseudomonas aeruginosa]MCO3303258.1 siderophore ABC transporter substrate-binding protein [Pseudomonas aeruginosa]